MATTSPVAAVACPVCGRYAVQEPGGTRCLTHGHLLTTRDILPPGHQLGRGDDWQNRERQRALDLAFARPGQAHRLIFDLLERLEDGPGGPGEDGA